MLNQTHALIKGNSWCQKHMTDSFQNKEYMHAMRRPIMHLSAPTIFLLSSGVCQKTFSISPLLPICSHKVPNELPLSFTSFQHLPQHIPSSTSLPILHVLANVVLLSPTLEWPVQLAQVWTNCKIRKVNIWHCFARYISNFQRVKYERKS